MQDEPKDVADNRPKVFNSITGWVGGITGIVIALAGLRAAYQQLMPAAPVATPSEAQGPAAPEATADENSAADESTASDLPLSYAGVDGLTLEWSGGLWVETNGDAVTRYEQLSRDDGMTYAIDRSRNVYVRWPNDGGMVEESDDNQAKWADSYSISVPEQAASPG